MALELNRSLEHQAQRRPIDSSAVNAKPDDATSVRIPGEMGQ
jgi:hypothetical protein